MVPAMRNLYALFVVR